MNESGVPITLSTLIHTCCSTSAPPSCALPATTTLTTLPPPVYATIWSHYTAHLLSSHNPTTPLPLLTLGILSHRSYTYGIKIPTFTANSRFCDKYNLRQRKSMESGQRHGKGGKWRVESFWTPSLALSTGITLPQVTFALTALTHALGSALRDSPTAVVAIDLGIGMFNGSNGEIDLQFSQTTDNTDPATRKHNAATIKRITTSIAADLKQLNVTPPALDATTNPAPSPRLPLTYTGRTTLTPTGIPHAATPRVPEPSTPTAANTATLAPAQMQSWSPVFSRTKPPPPQTGSMFEAPPTTPQATSTPRNCVVATNVPMHLHSTPTMPSASMPSASMPSASMPSLLDGFSRLPAAPLTDQTTTSSSARIARFFTPSTGFLELDKSAGRISFKGGEEVTVAGGDVFGMKAARIARGGGKEGEESGREGGGEEKTLSVEGAMNYLWYLDGGGVKDEVIEQLEEGVITRLLSKFPPASPSHTSITTSFVEEICSLRLRAVKKATLDYILMSPKERKRLGIEQIPPDVKVDGFGWGEGKLFLRSPGAWRDNFNGVLEKFGTYSIIATPITIANALWQDFEQLRLVDVVSGYRESLERGHPSVSIVVFEREQMSHLNSVVAEFKDNWLVNLKHIFAETISDGEYLVEEALMKRYMDAMTLVMQTHLRSTVTKSLERLVDFFEMFSESGAIARERVGEESDNLAVTEYTRPPPPFIIDLTLNHNSNASFFNEPPVKLTTSLDQVCSRVLNVFDNIVHAFDDFETVRPNTRSHAKKYLKVIDPQEELVVSARQRIVGIIQENMAVSMAALHVYEPYGYLIQKDAHRNNDTIDLESVDEVIDKFEKSCEDLGALPTTIPLVLVTLTSSGLHSAFDKIAEQNRRIAIEKIASECMSLNNVTLKSGRLLWSKLNKKPTNTDELILTENFLENVKAMDLPALETEVNGVKRQVTFLFTHNSLHGDTLDTVNTTYRQLGELRLQFEKATEIAHGERMNFEGNCKGTKKALVGSLTTVEEMVDTFKYKSDLKSMASKYLEELDSLAGQLGTSKLKASVINQEENKLGWVPTEFKSIGLIEDKIEPYRDLWNIALAFRSEYASWTRSPMLKLDGGEVEATHSSMTEKMEGLKSSFEDNEAVGPAGVADQILETLNGFKRYIPFLRALTNSRLDDSHWKSISSILGLGISSEDVAISWSNLNDQGILSVENVDAIAALSNEANREYDRVVFGDWMTSMAKMDGVEVPMVVEVGHPWVGSCYCVDKLGLEKIMFVVDEHKAHCSSIVESENGSELQEECKAFADKFGLVENWAGNFLETHVLWHGLVYQKSVDRETSHQISQADEQWRGILDELVAFKAEEGGAEEKKEKGVEGEEEAPATFKEASQDSRAKVAACAFSALPHFPALNERVVEVRDMLRAVRKGEDTRKLMRKMSRRASNLQRASAEKNQHQGAMVHALTASLKSSK